MDEYLQAHPGLPVIVSKLRWLLGKATAALGEVLQDSDQSLARTRAERDQVTLRAAIVDVSRTDYPERVPVRFELTPREYEGGVAQMLEEKFL